MHIRIHTYVAVHEMLYMRNIVLLYYIVHTKGDYVYKHSNFKVSEYCIAGKFREVLSLQVLQFGQFFVKHSPLNGTSLIFE